MTFEPAERSLRFDFAHRPSFDLEALDGEPVEGPKGRCLGCGKVRIDKEYT
jgi:hypothetical protein